MQDITNLTTRNQALKMSTSLSIMESIIRSHMEVKKQETGHNNTSHLRKSLVVMESRDTDASRTVESGSDSKNLLVKSSVAASEAEENDSKRLLVRSLVVDTGVAENVLKNLARSLVVDMEVAERSSKSLRGKNLAAAAAAAGVREASRNPDSRPEAFVVSRSDSRNRQERNLVVVGVWVDSKERETSGSRRDRRK